MAQSKYIDRTQKDKLKDLCMNIEYISPQEMKNYLENQSGELNKFKGEPWVNWRGYSLVIRGFDSHFTLATEMIARLQWQIENKNLDLAKEYWQITKGYLDVAGIENKCLLGLTSLDIYKNESKQKEFLDFTESIYNKYMIEGGNNVKREYQTTMCGLMLKGLYGITGKSKYGKGLEDNNTFLTKFNNDDGNNKNLEIAAQGGFYKSNNGGVFMPYKNVVENGLLINLLIN